MDFAVFDIEATGLDVKTVDVHCIVVHSPDGKTLSFRPDETTKGVAALNELMRAGIGLAGHNVIRYDIPVLRRFGLEEPEHVYDTLVVSRAAYPGYTLADRDKRFVHRCPEVRGTFRPGAHSLDAWGARLGYRKASYDGGWDTFTEEMLEYCVRDVGVNVRLFEMLRERIADEAALLDCQVAELCRVMEEHGVGFDRKKAEALTVELMEEREKLTAELQEVFTPWYEQDGKLRVPARNQTSRKYAPGEEGYTNVAKDCPFTKVKKVVFNPASTQHIAKRLIAIHGWRPQKFTDAGAPQVTAEVLNDLPYPEAPALARYQEIKKVLGYIFEGDNAWLRLEKSGRLHGTVMPTGTVSSRASHSRPNTGNVPSRTELGHRCRELFVAPVGRVLVGADASGLQLRGLGHYLAKWDGGDFARQCEDGDIHEYMREGTGLFLRSYQKTWTYAKLFGAGEHRLGLAALADWRAAYEQGLTEEKPPALKHARALGAQTLRGLGDRIPAFDALQEALDAAAKEGALRTLDGRYLPVSSAHIAIAMLLQGFEACVMKKAMVLGAKMISPVAQYVLWVHDEFQVETTPDNADHVGRSLVGAMAAAGRHYDLRVRIDGEYKIGTTWAETH